MMKIIVVLFTAVSLGIMPSILSASVEVTSSATGIVSYIAPVGKEVKEGDVLVKFLSSISVNNIKIKKIELASAIKDLQENELDYKRTSKLIKTNSISVSEAENSHFDYKKSQLHVEHLKLEIKNLEIAHDDYTIKAPENCKVVNVYISENSGADIGDKIMSIEYNKS
ncbi:MAG TPA: hypothetical protein QF753_04820 [Victivallales bacterium]|nr:hypothetical protein [Victivallales bacterium]